MQQVMLWDGGGHFVITGTMPGGHRGALPPKTLNFFVLIKKNAVSIVIKNNYPPPLKHLTWLHCQILNLKKNCKMNLNIFQIIAYSKQKCYFMQHIPALIQNFQWNLCEDIDSYWKYLSHPIQFSLLSFLQMNYYLTGEEHKKTLLVALLKRYARDRDIERFSRLVSSLLTSDVQRRLLQPVR